MQWLWRSLLRLYPRAHRREYGEEMLAALSFRHHRAGGGVRATVSSMWDLAAGAVGVWNDRLRRAAMGMGRGWILDARFLARSLGRSKGYVATAIAVLACAVAANATVLSYGTATLLSQPSWSDPASVMVVWGSNLENGQRRDVISGPSYLDLRDRVSALEPVAAVHDGGAYLIEDGRPEILDALEVTVEFLGLLGVEPMLGRDFDERERMSGGERSVIVTHGYWRDRLDRDPDALGRALPFASGPRTIVGVLPEGFEFLGPAAFLIPLHDDVLGADERSRIHYYVFGRLVDGASIGDAALELDEVARAIVLEHSGFEGWSFLVEPFEAVSVEAVRPALVTLLLTVTLVLFVALVNLATLFRIRALARSDELTVRRALGSGRLRLARVLTLETTVLATVGATLGLLATPFLLDRVRAMVPPWVPVPESAMSIPVLQAELTPNLAAATIIGTVIGAVLLSAPTLGGALRRSAQPLSGLRVHSSLQGVRLLVAVEVVAATALCIGAGLAVRSAHSLLATDVGVEPEGVLTLYVGDVWERAASERTSYFRQIVEAVERLPGVRRAGVTGYVDFQAEDDYAGIVLLDRETRPGTELREQWRRVDEGLFEAAGMTVLQGRAFVSTDFQGEPAVSIVNEAFAARHYPARSPVGERLVLSDEAYGELKIVGVLRDVRSLGPAAAAPPMLYAPYQGNVRGTQGMYVRVDGDPMGMAESIRDAVWSVDSSQPVMGVAPFQELVARWIAIPMATRTLVLSLALLTAFLSAVGVFGVVAYAVRTRRSELGVRMALGASPARLEADLVARMAPVATAGFFVGTVLAVTAARGARSVLYGVDPIDPLSILFALVAMGLAIGLATWLPARRAGRIDPSEAMRVD